MTRTGTSDRSWVARAAWTIAGLGAVWLAGCQNPRPIVLVEQSAAEAWDRGDMVLAEQEYAELVDRRPARVSDRLMLGRARAALGDWAGARDQLDIAYTIYPEDSEVLDLLTEARLQLGDTDGLAEELRLAARTLGRWTDWLRLGEALRRTGDLDAAEPALITAARLDSGRSLRPQLALAELYEEAGDAERALERYRMALYLDPSSGAARDAIRATGEIPGPTFALVPAEADLAD